METGMKFKEFVERNSMVGKWIPHSEIRIDSIAGNYMKGWHNLGYEWEAFVHTVPFGRGIQNGRVYKLRIMEPRQDISSPDEEGWTQDVRASYDRGWIIKADQPDVYQAVEDIVSMFPASLEAMGVPQPPPPAQDDKSVKEKLTGSMALGEETLPKKDWRGIKTSSSLKKYLLKVAEKLESVGRKAEASKTRQRMKNIPTKMDKEAINVVLMKMSKEFGFMEDLDEGFFGGKKDKSKGPSGHPMGEKGKKPLAVIMRDMSGKYYAENPAGGKIGSHTDEKVLRAMLKKKGYRLSENKIFRDQEWMELIWEKSIPDQHQIAIAKKTLKMSGAGAKIMGGMTKDEARKILKKHGIKEGTLLEFGQDEYVYRLMAQQREGKKLSDHEKEVIKKWRAKAKPQLRKAFGEQEVESGEIGQDADLECDDPGKKRKSKGRGKGLEKGKGKGPLGEPKEEDIEWARELYGEDYAEKLQEAKVKLKDPMRFGVEGKGKPKVCPHCKGKKVRQDVPTKGAPCPTCGGRGWVR